MRAGTATIGGRFGVPRTVSGGVVKAFRCVPRETMSELQARLIAN